MAKKNVKQQRCFPVQKGHFWICSDRTEFSDIYLAKQHEKIIKK